MNLPLHPPPPQNKRQMVERLREILQSDWQDMPAGEVRYNGTGGPGNFLEDLLGLASGNKDVPDCIGWEVKFFTPKTNLVTLFHKEPEPEGIMRQMVTQYGWKDRLGRLSFRHTISGRSDRFVVVDEHDSIVVRPLNGDGPSAMWTYDTLLNIAGGKLRRLVGMQGQRKGRSVKYECAHLYQNLHLTRLTQEILSGRIAVDFDAREQSPGSTALRNHGTKFRVHRENLSGLYQEQEQLTLT